MMPPRKESETNMDGFASEYMLTQKWIFVNTFLYKNQKEFICIYRIYGRLS
jgi:hypothetical protein